MLSSTALRHFAEVARSGSLRAAADRLFVAASAVSRQIGLLEDELGTALFERRRGPTPMRLTPAGEALVELVAKMEAEVQRTLASIAAMQAPERETLRVGIAESLTLDFMPGFLAGFGRTHPDADLRAHVAPTSHLLEMLRADELDAALAFNALMLPGLRAIYERELATCALVSADHPLAGRKHVAVHECADYPMALPDPSIELTRVNDDTFGRVRLQPRRALLSNSYVLLRTVCAAGLGVAIVTEPIGRQALATGTHRYVPLSDARARHFGVFVRQGARHGGALKRFLEELVAELRSVESTPAPGRKRATRSSKGNNLL